MPKENNNRQIGRYKRKASTRRRVFLLSALFIAASLLYSGCDAVVDTNNSMDTIRTPTTLISISNLRSGDGFVSFQIKNNTPTALNITLTIEPESTATYTFLISGYPEWTDSDTQFFLPSATVDDTATQVRISQLENGKAYRAVITVSDTQGKILSEPIKQDIMAMEAPLAPAPDLIVTQTITHQNALPGSTAQWNATIRNIGAVSSPSATIRYLIINPSGTQSEWSMATVPQIPPNGMEAEMSSFSYPDSTGAYIIRVCVDAVTGERNSNNNCSTGIRIQSIVNSETLQNFATAISLDSPVTGNITRNSEKQYYAIQSTTARTITLSIRSSAIDAHWFFADDSNTELATHNSTGQKRTYSYTIRANSRYYIGVNSARPAETGVYTLHITTPTSKPTAPVNFHAIPTDKSVNLLWSDVEDAASYRVYRADSGNTPVRIAESAAILTAGYVDNTVTNGQSYSYTVRAVNSIGESGDSATISATPNATIPAHGNSVANADTIALPSTTNGTLTGSDSDYFKVVTSSAGTLHAYSTGNDNPTGAIVDSSDTVLASNSGGGISNNFYLSYDIPAAGTYYLRITGDNPGANTHYYTLTVRLDTASNRIPATPTGFRATAGNTQITLSWDTVSNATEYRIYRAIGLSTSYARLVSGTKITGTTYIDSGLTNGVPHSYYIRAVNSSGESVQSASESAVPRPPMSTMSDPAELIGTWTGADPVFSGRMVTLQFTATKYIFTDFLSTTTCDYTATTTEITIRNCNPRTRKDGAYTYSIHMNSLTHLGYTLTKQ